MYMASKIEHLAWHLQLTRFAKYYSSTVYTITIRKIKSKSASIVEVLLTLSVTFIVLCMNKQIRISLSLSNLSLDYSYETNKSKWSFHSCRLGCYFYIDDAFSHGFKNNKKSAYKLHETDLIAIRFCQYLCTNKIGFLMKLG